MDQQKRAKALDLYSQARQAIVCSDYPRAITLASEAESFFLAEDEPEILCAIEILLGYSYSLLDDQQRSFDNLLRALTAAQVNDLPLPMAQCFNNIGAALLSFHDFDTAGEYFERAAGVLRGAMRTRGEQSDVQYAMVMLNIAAVRLYQNRYDEAAEALEIVHPLTENPGFAEYSMIYTVTRATLDWRTGRRDIVLAHIPELEQALCTRENRQLPLDGLQKGCELLAEAGAFDAYHRVLLFLSKYDDTTIPVRNRLTVLRMWMAYYQGIQDTANYRETCIRFGELCTQTQDASDRLRVRNIRTRIALFEQEQNNRLLTQKYNIDTLTGIGNRNKMEKDAEALYTRGGLIAVGVLDIDNFKHINDTFGHIAGDVALKRTAETLTACCSAGTEVYRFGGDEFIVLFHDGSPETVRAFARNVQSKLTGTDLVTMSQGFICFTIAPDDTFKARMYTADLNLYAIKQAGKNSYRISLRDTDGTMQDVTDE